jgi:hypothetical protein|nr:MAG TPA: hypothetical protein [Caudoviricetes sp.]DAS77529.1 MAG TPA: hypothetical protein [Caudoviricetes sp.]
MILTTKTIFIVEIKELNTPYSTTFKMPSTKKPEGIVEELNKLGFKIEPRYNEDGQTVYKLTCKKFVLRGKTMKELETINNRIKDFIH